MGCWDWCLQQKKHRLLDEDNQSRDNIPVEPARGMIVSRGSVEEERSSMVFHLEAAQQPREEQQPWEQPGFELSEENRKFRNKKPRTKLKDVFGEIMVDRSPQTETTEESVEDLKNSKIGQRPRQKIRSQLSKDLFLAPES